MPESPNRSFSPLTASIGLPVVPVGLEVARRLGARHRCQASISFARAKIVAFSEELVAAAVVRMKVRVHHDIDVVGPKARAREARQQGLVSRSSSGFVTLASGPQRPPRHRPVGRMTAGIEQHVALLMADQRAADGKVDGFAAVGTRHVDLFFMRKPTGGEKIRAS